ADLGGAQQLLELADAGLLLALFLACGVVATVLLEVALLASGVDLRGDDGAIRDQLVELVLEPVVGLLGQPGHLRVHGHHSSSGPVVHPRARAGPSGRAPDAAVRVVCPGSAAGPGARVRKNTTRLRAVCASP